MAIVLGKLNDDWRRVITCFAYVAIVLSLIIVVCFELSGLFEEMSAVATDAELLAQIQSRETGPHTPSPSLVAPAATRSLFLEGSTLTVAGAALQQRVNSAIKSAGGTALSSEIEFRKSLLLGDEIGLLTDLELKQSELQPLLYDLESGVPFLFVNRLSIHFLAARDSRMQVQLEVSGSWQATK
jgi:general secretion pathway protein M